jgi:hypothetical protein
MNPVVTVLCAGGICSAIQGKFAWTGAMLIIAMVIAVYSNMQWSKVFKASAVIIAAWAAKKR